MRDTRHYFKAMNLEKIAIYKNREIAENCRYLERLQNVK